MSRWFSSCACVKARRRRCRRFGTRREMCACSSVRCVSRCGSHSMHIEPYANAISRVVEAVVVRWREEERRKGPVFRAAESNSVCVGAMEGRNSGGRHFVMWPIRICAKQRCTNSGCGDPGG